MAFVKQEKKNNRGHAPGWHSRFIEDYGEKRYNCPCKGKEHAVSPRLEARLAHFETAQLGNISGYHKPGSQNRKK